MNIKQSLLNLKCHRSKDRIRYLGEVFTPEKYVFQMLDMLDKSVWSNIDVVFFEPTCGHGNFVVAIVQRRLEKLFKKAKKQKIEEPHFYAVAHTLNTLWAIDIDPQNIRLCRNRIYSIIFNFLLEHEERKQCQYRFSLDIFIRKNKKYLTHTLCCIQYQIHTNEALSCLEIDYFEAQKNANKTLVSKLWLQSHRHRPINFEKDWASYFKTCQKKGITPIEYKRNSKCLEKVIKSHIKGINIKSNSTKNRTKAKFNKKILHTKKSKKIAA